MAHFYGSLQGNRGMATRLGTKDSGIDGHIRGWDVGGRVTCFHHKDRKQDEATLFVTGGSNRSGGTVVADAFETGYGKPPAVTLYDQTGMTAIRLNSDRIAQIQRAINSARLAGQDITGEQIAKLFNEPATPPHLVYFVMQTQTNEEGEYQALIAVEGERGYRLTDWYWGKDYEVATKIANDRNAEAGIDELEAMKIQASTMRK